MKTVHLKWTNHKFGIIGECGRMHAWCETEEQAEDEYYTVLNTFDNVEIVKLKVNPTSEYYPCASMRYHPV